MATAPITPLAWKLPYAAGATPKRQKTKKKKKLRFFYVEKKLLKAKSQLSCLNGYVTYIIDNKLILAICIKSC